jgi:hypothetical protein
MTERGLEAITGKEGKKADDPEIRTRLQAGYRMTGAQIYYL